MSVAASGMYWHYSEEVAELQDSMGQRPVFRSFAGFILGFFSALQE